MFFRTLMLLLVFLPFTVFGEAQVYDAKVVNVRVDKSGKGYVRFDIPLSGTPASCIIGHSEHLAFDLSTDGGKGIMSIALEVDPITDTMNQHL